MYTHIITIHNGENVGDKNQSLGIATALMVASAPDSITQEEYSTKDRSAEGLNEK